MVKKICQLVTFLVSFEASSLDQSWTSLQGHFKLKDSKQLNAEYMRRDTESYFNDRFLDIYRFHYVGVISNFNYFIGAAYFDFDRAADERRIHQYFTKNFAPNELVEGFLRLGFEERFFVNDPNIHLRVRFRAQTFLFPEKPIGPVFYNEMFFTPDGHEKFGTGFNENRFGFGARYSVKNIEANFFLVRTYIKKPDETNDWPLWAQIQIVCRI